MRVAECHPESKHYAHGQCRTCYMATYERRKPICHPEAAGHGAKLCSTCHQRQRRYGMSPEEYAQLVEAQGGACAVCREPEGAIDRNGRPKPLSVDHDHRTGEVRGLLCNGCNTALGLMRDQPDLLLAAAAYLYETRVSPLRANP